MFSMRNKTESRSLLVAGDGMLNQHEYSIMTSETLEIFKYSLFFFFSSLKRLFPKKFCEKIYSSEVFCCALNWELSVTDMKDILGTDGETDFCLRRVCVMITINLQQRKHNKTRNGSSC